LHIWTLLFFVCFLQLNSKFVDQQLNQLKLLLEYKLDWETEKQITWNY